MAPTVPTVAYVGYKDGHKAIVAVSLIKNYAPSSLTDLQKDKDAYWRSRGSEDEGFYPADVLELGVTQTDLVKRLAKRRIPVPDSIFEDGVSATEVMKKAVSAKDAAAKVRAANKKKMQRLKQHSTSSSSDDDSVVPRAVLLDEQRKSSVLKRKLTTLRQEYHELQVRYNSLQDRHGKLEYVLLHKLGVSANFRETQAVLPGESDGGDNGSSTAGCSSGFHGSLDLVSDSTDLPQLVHLGNNVFVSAARWEWLLSRKKDSLFVKELTKTVWGVANLRDRSVTGAPCRRFLNTKDLGTVPKKRALTPRKLHAVGSECLCWDICSFSVHINQF
ncbi:hypothetical protein HPB48_006511 [Haemaphysalis longicornis]|uniref:BEN domain-containing protein n=1 Tax=Haemaphysalis longicornis TaxID=44386 RepID=A0A9J6FXP4_HAELO|nr:hypothetical protein HPB48_006511 [Haemaphysalis longicornis]